MAVDLYSVAKAKGKRPEQVTITDLTGAGMDFGAAQSAIMGAAEASFKAMPQPTYVPAGPTPDAQKLGADLMNRAIATGMTNATNIQKNATEQKIDMAKAYGSNPVTGVYNPVTGLGNAVAEAAKPITAVGGMVSAEGTRPQQQVAAGVAYSKPPQGTVVEPQPVQPAATPATQLPTSITPRAVSPTVQAILDQLNAKTKVLPRTAEEIMSGPEYQALKKANDLKRGMAQAQLNRSFASRNMLRSTPAIQALAGSDAVYEAEDTANLLKSIEVADQRRRQEIADLQALLNTNLGVEDQAFSQGVSEFNAFAPYKYETASSLAQRTDRQKEFDYGVDRDKKTDERQARQDANATATTRATFTGRLFLPEDQPIVDEAVNAKAEYEVLRGQGVAADDPRLVALSLKAVNARNKLTSLGYADVDKLLGAEVTSSQAKTNAGQLGYVKGKTAKEIYDEALATLNYEIATSPTIGLKAEAEAKMAKLKAETEKAQRNSGEGGITPMQQYQILRDIMQDERRDTERQEDKENREQDRQDRRDEASREENIKSMGQSYQGVGRKALELWNDMVDAGTKGNLTWDAMKPAYQAAVGYKGLSTKDVRWLTLKWAEATGEGAREDAGGYQLTPTELLTREFPRKY